MRTSVAGVFPGVPPMIRGACRSVSAMGQRRTAASPAASRAAAATTPRANAAARRFRRTRTATKLATSYAHHSAPSGAAYVPPKPTHQAAAPAVRTIAQRSPASARRTPSAIHGSSSNPKKLTHPSDGDVAKIPPSAKIGAARRAPKFEAPRRRA